MPSTRIITSWENFDNLQPSPATSNCLRVIGATNWPTNGKTDGTHAQQKTHPISAKSRRCISLLEGGQAKAIYEFQGEQSIRKIAETVDISRNTVRRYLRDPDGALVRKPRPKRPPSFDPYKEHVSLSPGSRQLRCAAAGNPATRLHRRIHHPQGLGRLLRRRPAPGQPMMRFETSPGQQAQVASSSFAYRTPDVSVPGRV